MKLSHEDARYVKQMAHYVNDPVSFGTDILNASYTAYQAEVLTALAESERVAWRSAHGMGKTYTAADAVLWFLFTRPSSRIITTASVWRQVSILWAEIAARAQRMDLKRLGWRWPIDILGGSIRIDRDWFAKGVSSDDSNKIEGQHARYILYVVDEAKLVPSDTFSSIEGALTSEGAKLLVISTPSESTSGYFYEIWRSRKPYRRFHTSAFDSPNMEGITLDDIRSGDWKRTPPVIPSLTTAEWVAGRLKEWGEGTLWQTKVLGEFPTTTEDTLIPYSWAERATNSNLPHGLPVELGVDVARFGSDQSVVFVRHGQRARLHTAVSKRDTMYVAGLVIAAMQQYGASLAKIDTLNMGAGAVDRLLEQGIRVLPIGAAERARDSSRFANVRAEGYWHLRDLFQDGQIAIEDDPNLIQELCAIKYRYNSKGQIIIEPKEAIRKRIGRSPDKADTLMYAFLPRTTGEARDIALVGKSFNSEVKW